MQLQYRPQYFYLADGVSKIELMEVGRLASLSLTLEPLPEGNKAFGHAAALHDYMNKNRDHFLFNSYSLLITDDSGKELLCSNISLCLLEKSFREEGASKESIKAYVTTVNQYHALLNANAKEYGQESHKNK